MSKSQRKNWRREQARKVKTPAVSRTGSNASATPRDQVVSRGSTERMNRLQIAVEVIVQALHHLYTTAAHQTPFPPFRAHCARICRVDLCFALI